MQRANPMNHGIIPASFGAERRSLNRSGVILVSGFHSDRGGVSTSKITSVMMVDGQSLSIDRKGCFSGIAIQNNVPEGPLDLASKVPAKSYPHFNTCV